MSEARSAEESRSWPEEPFGSKNEMLHFVQHDIDGRVLLHPGGACSINGILVSNITGISRSPFHGSLEMTNGEEPFLNLSFRTPERGEKSLRRLNLSFKNL